jgi:hypothetical protein
MPKKITIVTGPIVGLKSTNFIEETVAFAASLGEKIIHFNLFREILEQDGIKPRNAYEEILCIGNLINGYEYQFKSLREKAYLSIARKINCLGKDTSVVMDSASIEWRGYNIILKDHRTIAEAIDPDLIVTLINAEWKIKVLLAGRYGRHVLKAVCKRTDAALATILRWLAAEVSISEDWAEWASFISKKKVKHIVLGIETPSVMDRKRCVRDVEGLAKLVTQKDVPTIYTSYSMTVATEKVRKKINDLIWKMRAYGVVIDPASIELGANVEEELKSTIFAYTVCRDLRWDVQKVDAVVAFHPYIKNPPLSTGMLDELGHARAYYKDRYLLLPAGGGSPFTKDNYVPSNHVFKTQDDFFDFIENRRRPTLKPKYVEFQKAFKKWQKATFRKKKKGGK